MRCKATISISRRPATGFGTKWKFKIPENVEPYAMSEAIQKIAEDETAANARLAEAGLESRRASSSKEAFSAKPSFSLRPTGSGVSVFVRYITRVNERHEVRDRIYRAALELLRNAKGGESTAPPAPPLKPVNEPA